MYDSEFMHYFHYSDRLAVQDVYGADGCILYQLCEHLGWCEWSGSRPDCHHSLCSMLSKPVALQLVMLVIFGVTLSKLKCGEKLNESLCMLLIDICCYAGVNT